MDLGFGTEGFQAGQERAYRGHRTGMGTDLRGHLAGGFENLGRIAFLKQTDGEGGGEGNFPHPRYPLPSLAPRLLNRAFLKNQGGSFGAPVITTQRKPNFSRIILSLSSSDSEEGISQARATRSSPSSLSLRTEQPQPNSRIKRVIEEGRPQVDVKDSGNASFQGNCQSPADSLLGGFSSLAKAPK